MNKNRYIDLIIIGFIFLILFVMPALFVRVDGAISWKHVTKIWQDNSPLILIFILHHWLLLPLLMEKRKYTLYILSIVGLIVLAAWVCNMMDSSIPVQYSLTGKEVRPSPVPPYANMMMYAILITGVDVGLFFSKMWQKNEKRALEFEKRNTAMELEMLRSQISPHFFMNTLNNIYALTETDSAKAKSAIMKLSKLMRYLLYENNGARVLISREFEFIQNYIDLMKLRYTDDVTFDVHIPDLYDDIEIPPMLFISYIENAVKHGVSYQEKCVIKVRFCLTDESLLFSCSNDIHRNTSSLNKGGLGLKNSQMRLSLIYGSNYDLKISEEDDRYNVLLKIPIE
jgi:hypothetical protein